MKKQTLSTGLWSSILMILLIFHQSAQATTITVDTTDDELSKVIHAANAAAGAVVPVTVNNCYADVASDLLGGGSVLGDIVIFESHQRHFHKINSCNG